MDILNTRQLPKTCIEHNQPVIFVDPDPKKGTFCSICIQNLTGLVSIYQLKQQQYELIDKSNKENNLDKQQLQNAIEIILNFQKNFNQSLDKIIQLIKDQIEDISSYLEQIQMVIQSEAITSLTIEELNEICESKQKNNTQFRNQVEQQFQKLVIENDVFDKLINLFDNQQQESKLENQQISKNFQYELLKDSSIKESEYCRAFAFDKEGNKLIVACGKEIIVQEFINGKRTKELQKFTNHTDDVSCLYFMKQSNSFVSGSNTYQPKTYLKEHQNYVTWILMNKSEDLLISGSYDKTVKFWIKIDNKWKLKQTIVTKKYIYSISLNEYENKLISCGFNSPISIIQLQNDNTWSIVQSIQVREWGYRLTFVKGNQFIFQPKTKDFIEQYDFDEQQKQFQKLKEIKVQKCSKSECLFPCQYLQYLNILTVKHGNFLNIFKINDEEDYQLIQTIDYLQNLLFGRLSDDGRYLVTWDNGSKEIQIRELKYLE